MQYGDANVETFYTINSYATCNNPDLYSEVDFEYLPWDAWHWERKTTMYYTSWETCEIRDHVKSVQSFAGWHDLVYTAAEGQPVKWYIDGQLMGTMEKHTPDSDVNISFANWIYQNTTGSSTTTRTTTMQVDWVYHAKDVILTTQEVLQKVASLRQNKVLRKNLQGDQVVDGNLNPAPVVSITSPANNATFTAPATITINATATDANGTVTKVEFYNGSTKIGEDLTAPYSFTWTNVAAGNYAITAKATDNQGGVGSSAILLISVGNIPPTISITSPANNTNFAPPAAITITATASDADGSIAKVEFFNGTTKLGEDATAPYSFTWVNVGVGNYSVIAKATDNKGASQTSSSVAVSVSTVVPVPLEAVYKTIATWEAGFQGEVRVYNQSTTPVSGWTVQLDCPHTLSPIWDAAIVAHNGSRYTISSVATTQTIAPGQSVVFGFLGIIDAGQTFTPPTIVSAKSGTSARISLVEKTDLVVKTYPSPTAGRTNFEFALNEESDAELTVYTSGGSLVHRTVYKKLPVGVNKLIWDGSKQGSGLFFYQLKVNNTILTNKILLSK
jgi:hypothetical protein